MKKFFTIIFILANTTLFSQTEFAPLGAKWTYYTKTFMFSSYGFEQLAKFTCVNSYNNNGRQIKVINSEITRQDVTYTHSVADYQYSNRTTVNKVDSFYEINDTIFVYNKYLGKFTQLYRFNAHEGEVITQPIYDTSFTNTVNSSFSGIVTHNDDSFSYKIDSIRMVNYNGDSIETYYTSPVYTIDWASAAAINGIFGQYAKTYRPLVNWAIGLNLIRVYNPYGNGSSQTDSTPFLISKGAYLKQVGGLGAGLIPATDFIEPFIIDGYSFVISHLACYEDSAVNYTFGTFPCDSFTINSPLSLSSVSTLSNIKIFPNPVLENELFIQSEKKFPRGTKLHIRDILGKEVLAVMDLSDQNRQTIDVSSVQAGVYFLIFEMEAQRYYQKFQKL